MLEHSCRATAKSHDLDLAAILSFAKPASNYCVSVLSKEHEIIVRRHKVKAPWCPKICSHNFLMRGN